jgi:clumping factor A
MKKKTFKALIIIVACFFFQLRVSAGDVSIVTNNRNPSVGSNVVVTVKAPNVAGNFSVTSSNQSVLSGGSSNSWIEGSVTYTFVAKAAGTATITVKPIDAADYDGNVFSAVKSVTITVGNKTTSSTKKDLSSDNTLSSLSIDGVNLEPAFDKNTTSYNVNLEAGVTKINVKATPNDKSAKVTGIGEIEVSEGNNNIEVVVTAENGSTKTYTITANVKEYDPINVKVENSKYTVVRNIKNVTAPNGYEETKIKIKGEEVPAFKNKTTGYTLVLLKDDKGNQNFYIYKDKKYILYKEYTFNKIILYPMELKKVPKGYKKTKITFNDDKIIAYKKNKKSNYALIYGMNVETGKKHIYMYDKEEDTLQIYNDELNDVSDEKIEQYKMLIAGLSGLSVLLFLILIIVIMKNHKHNKEQKRIRKQIKKERKQKKKANKFIDEDDIDIKQIM